MGARYSTGLEGLESVKSIVVSIGKAGFVVKGFVDGLFPVYAVGGFSAIVTNVGVVGGEIM